MLSLSPCFLTRAASYLPGPTVTNDQIQTYLGEIEGETEVRDSVLKMNGIVGRHYAQDRQQNATDDVYGMAAKAVNGLSLNPSDPKATFLAAGTTYAPWTGPGIGTLLHDRLRVDEYWNRPLEISSQGGICTSSAAAMVGAIRAVQTGQHQAAISVGSEHASEVLKSSVFHPIDDRNQHSDIKRSQWFMSAFLRFMLSDGAGAFLFQSTPSISGTSLRVDWTHSMSFAHSTQLCMKMESRTARLSQDVSVLSRHLFDASRKFLGDAMNKHGESMDRYSMVLPHLSSFFFRRKMERIMQEHVRNPDHTVAYWTNLASVGNTGSASIYVMLDQFLRENRLADGQRILLFVPESGQFNFVLVSLTAITK
jgi:3-oxoacyl-[acyl-carrier-protein] synthase III